MDCTETQKVKLATEIPLRKTNRETYKYFNFLGPTKASDLNCLMSFPDRNLKRTKTAIENNIPLQ